MPEKTVLSPFDFTASFNSFLWIDESIPQFTEPDIIVSVLGPLQVESFRYNLGTLKHMKTIYRHRIYRLCLLKSNIHQLCSRMLF